MFIQQAKQSLRFNSATACLTVSNLPVTTTILSFYNLKIEILFYFLLLKANLYLFSIISRLFCSFSWINYHNCHSNRVEWLNLNRLSNFIVLIKALIATIVVNFLHSQQFTMDFMFIN